jgi:anti-sigma regulatory factor (Ser/Thr protein kinase)
MQVLLRLDLPEDMAHLALLRRATREALAGSPVPPKDAEDIEVILGELATNAVVHARAGGDYRVEIVLEADGLAVVTVADQGVGFSREAVPPPGTPRADADGVKERLGGWGLPMVEMLADSVEIVSNVPHGTRVRVEKRFAGVAPGEQPWPLSGGAGQLLAT